MPDSFDIWGTPVVIGASPEEIKRVSNTGRGTLHYAGDAEVSAQDEALERDDSVDLEVPAWFISDSSSHVTVSVIDSDDADVAEVAASTLAEERQEEEEEQRKEKEKADKEAEKEAEEEEGTTKEPKEPTTSGKK